MTYLLVPIAVVPLSVSRNTKVCQCPLFSLLLYVQTQTKNKRKKKRKEKKERKQERNKEEYRMVFAQLKFSIMYLSLLVSVFYRIHSFSFLLEQNKPIDAFGLDYWCCLFGMSK